MKIAGQNLEATIKVVTIVAIYIFTFTQLVPPYEEHGCYNLETDFPSLGLKSEPNKKFNVDSTKLMGALGNILNISSSLFTYNLYLQNNIQVNNKLETIIYRNQIDKKYYLKYNERQQMNSAPMVFNNILREANEIKITSFQILTDETIDPQNILTNNCKFEAIVKSTYAFWQHILLSYIIFLIVLSTSLAIMKGVMKFIFVPLKKYFEI